MSNTLAAALVLSENRSHAPPWEQDVICNGHWMFRGDLANQIAAELKSVGRELEPLGPWHRAATMPLPSGSFRKTFPRGWTVKANYKKGIALLGLTIAIPKTMHKKWATNSDALRACMISILSDDQIIGSVMPYWNGLR